MGSAFTGELAGGGEEEKNDSKDVVSLQEISWPAQEFAGQWVESVIPPNWN